MKRCWRKNLSCYTHGNPLILTMRRCTNLQRRLLARLRRPLMSSRIFLWIRRTAMNFWLVRSIFLRNIPLTGNLRSVWEHSLGGFRGNNMEPQAIDISKVDGASGLWQEIVDESSDGWIWHTWLAHEVNLEAGRGYGAHDLSFFV